jgi:hypothetical protein
MRHRPESLSAHGGIVPDLEVLCAVSPDYRNGRAGGRRCADCPAPGGAGRARSGAVSDLAAWFSARRRLSESPHGGPQRSWCWRGAGFGDHGSRPGTLGFGSRTAMARPGLEPGTPRFSVVRPSRLKPTSLQRIPWILAMRTASAFSRTLRSYPRRYGRWRGSAAFSSVAMAILTAGGAAPHVGCPWRSATRLQFSLCDRRSQQ